MDERRLNSLPHVFLSSVGHLPTIREALQLARRSGDESLFIEGWEPETREHRIEPLRMKPADTDDEFVRIWRWTPEPDDEDAVP